MVGLTDRCIHRVLVRPVVQVFPGGAECSTGPTFPAHSNCWRRWKDRSGRQLGDFGQNSLGPFGAADQQVRHVGVGIVVDQRASVLTKRGTEREKEAVRTVDAIYQLTFARTVSRTCGTTNDCGAD